MTPISDTSNQQKILTEFDSKYNIILQSIYSGGNLTVMMDKLVNDKIFFVFDSPMAQFTGHIDINYEAYPSIDEVKDQLIEVIKQTIDVESMKLAHHERLSTKPSIN